MSNARDLADLAASASTVPTTDKVVGKSLIINGGVTVLQRGTSFTGLGAANDYMTDRWMVNYGGSTPARFTATQSTDVPSNGDFAYSLKIDCTTVDSSIAAADLMTIETRLEGQDLQHLDFGAAGAKTITASFWVKSAKTGIHCFFCNTGASTRSYISEFTIAVADTWEEFSLVIPGDASGVIANDNTEEMRVGFALIAGSNYQAAKDTWLASGDFASSSQQNLLDNIANNFLITGVKLEVGSATAFEHESYGDTLAKCQRYFWRPVAAAYDPVCMVAVYAASTAIGNIPFPTKLSSSTNLS